VDDLITWLRDCLDREAEVAQVADALTASPWMSAGTAVKCGEQFPVAMATDGERATAEHIAMQDPAHTLARIDSDRTLVARLEGLLLHVTSPNYADSRTAAWTTGSLKAIAQRYAGWDGWREEWRA